MATADLELDLMRARVALGEAGDPIGRGEPRFALFHAANSICSQKVRAVLTQHAIPYVSHQLKLFEGQTYLPEYVRLRMRGCAALGGALADHHSGSTAVDGGGCDGAVVPTLVDLASGDVLVDSKRICLHLDAAAPTGERLRPDELADAVDAQLEIVDALPNYQLLMGRTPKGAERPESRSDTLAAFSQRKVAWCDRYLEEHAGDETLARAYRAKRAKEASAAEGLFSPEAMRDAYGRAEATLGALDATLAGRDGPWLFGERLTMADLFWGIELIRMEDVGTAAMWEAGRLPHVARFAAATQALPAIRAAILDWPGARF